MTEFIIANDIGTTRVKSLGVYKLRSTLPPNRFEVESILGETRELLSEDQSLMKITTQDGEWFIGPSAMQYSRNHIRGRDKRWPFTPQYRALHLYAIAQHISSSATSVDVDLISALPYSDRKNSEEIKESLLGNHIVELPDRTIKININFVYFAIQGIAALMADAPFNGSIVTWLGLGGRNKTYATIAHGKIIADKTNSTEGGMLSAIDDFTNMIRDLTDLQLTEPEAIKAISTGQLMIGSENLDIRQYATKAIEPYCDSVFDLIGSVWPVSYMPRINDFRLGGGGALGIGNIISKEYKQARVVKDPRWTEADGLLKMGISRYGS